MDRDEQVRHGQALSAMVELLAEWALAVDVDGLTVAEVDVVIAGMCRLQEEADGVIVRCADRARRLETDGVGSPAEESLTAGGRTRPLAARDIVASSEVTEAFPLLGPIIRSGQAPRGSVHALVTLWRRLSSEERQRFISSFDHELAERVVDDSPDVFHALVRRRGRAVRTDDGGSEAESERAANRLERSRLRDGRFRYLLEVDPLTDEELLGMVESKAWSTLNAHRDTDSRRRPDDASKAEALVDLLRAGAADDSHGLPRSFSLGVIVDQQTLRSGVVHDRTVCETDGGTAVPLGLLSRFACDAVVETYHLDGSGRPFDLGRKRRTASAEQRRALRIQYQSCPLSGTPLVDCEIHHLDYWDDGGSTDYDNLIPLSRRWHHLVHDKGWTISRTSAGGLKVQRPDGTHHRTIAAPTPITRRDDPRPIPGEEAA